MLGQCVRMPHPVPAVGVGLFEGELQQFSRDAGALMIEIGLIKSMPDVDTLFDARFVK